MNPVAFHQSKDLRPLTSRTEPFSTRKYLRANLPSRLWSLGTLVLVEGRVSFHAHDLVFGIAIYALELDWI